MRGCLTSEDAAASALGELSDDVGPRREDLRWETFKAQVDLHEMATQQRRLEAVRRVARFQAPELCALVLQAAQGQLDVSSSEAYELTELALEIAWAADRNQPGTRRVQELLAQCWACLGAVLRRRGALADAGGAIGIAAFYQQRTLTP
jgi:formate dehydrogenase maturation protein FdhE